MLLLLYPENWEEQLVLFHPHCGSRNQRHPGHVLWLLYSGTEPEGKHTTCIEIEFVPPQKKVIHTKRRCTKYFQKLYVQLTYLTYAIKKS